MKKTVIINLLIGLCVLSSCDNNYRSFYYVHIESTDSLQPIQFQYNADKGKTEYSQTVMLPFDTSVPIASSTFKIKVTVCRLNNTRLIRGMISTDQMLNINGETESPYHSLFADNAAIMTPDSMLNYLKQTNNYGYFELQPNESCKSITSK